MKSVIELSSSTVFLETNLRCYCGCPYCYKGNEVSSRGFIVPLHVLKERIKWIVKNVNPSEIGQIGGEPLLHPDFIEICKFIMKLGKKLRITTSGRISNLPYQKKNLEYALKLYEEGRLAINLSFHPDRSEKDYSFFLKQIKDRSINHRKNAKRLGLYDENGHDLFTLVSMDRRHQVRMASDDLYRLILDQSYFEDESQRKKYQDDLAEVIAENYAPTFAESKGRTFEITAKREYDGFRHKILFSCMEEIKLEADGGHKVVMAQGIICNATKTKIGKTSISVDDMLIKTNGDVVFAQVHCVPMTYGLCNTDIHLTSDDIYETMSKSIRQINTIVYMANRRRAAQNCLPDGTETECTACPTYDMCGFCHSIKRDW